MACLGTPSFHSCFPFLWRRKFFDHYDERTYTLFYLLHKKVYFTQIGTFTFSSLSSLFAYLWMEAAGVKVSRWNSTIVTKNQDFDQIFSRNTVLIVGISEFWTILPYFHLVYFFNFIRCEKYVKSQKLTLKCHQPMYGGITNDHKQTSAECIFEFTLTFTNYNRTVR